jgi:hypothetical protein
MALQLFSCASMNKNANYHFKINQALVYHIDGNYKKSAHLYKKAFKLRDGYADDIFNALLNAQELQDSCIAFGYAKELAKRGACIELFNTFPIISCNKIYLSQLNFISKNSSFNSYYRDQLGLIANKDQEVREKSKYNRETYLVDSLNRIRFVTLVKQFGYPSEKEIGITCTPSYSGLNLPPQDIFLWHFAKNNWIEKGILDNAFQKGLLHPKNYIQYKGIYQKDYLEVLPELILWINDGYYTPKIDSKIKQKINRNRKRLGLPLIDIELKIIKYKITNSSRIRGDWAYSGYEMPDSIVQLKYQPFKIN